MEKRNEIAADRTPCNKKHATFCDCSKCGTRPQVKTASEVASIADIETLAKVHKK